MGEQFALKNLTDEVFSSIVPYLKIIDYKDIDKIGKSFQLHFKNTVPFYLNSHETLESEYNCLIKVLELLSSIGFSPIPVISLASTDTYLKYISNNRSKYPRLLFHLKGQEILTEASTVRSLISQIGYTCGECDLLIDLFQIDPKVDQYIYTRYASKAISTLSLLQFNTIIFSASTFPERITSIGQNTTGSLRRLEWIIYKELLKNHQNIIFSDYGNDDPFDVVGEHGFKIVPTIKYTFEDYWYIYRGHYSNSRPNDFTQYHELSRNLIGDTKIYQGKTFSWGDTKIHECAQIFECLPKCNHSHPPEWVKRTMNHHITYVVSQLTSLSSSLDILERTR